MVDYGRSFTGNHFLQHNASEVGFSMDWAKLKNLTIKTGSMANSHLFTD